MESARENPIPHPHLPFNFTVGVLDGAFFGFALGFGSFLAVIPLFVKGLTDSTLLIGLIPAIHNVGWQLPQILMAGQVSRARRFKPLVMWTTIHERLPFLGMAIVAWFLPSLGAKTALLLLFPLLIWQGLGGGFTANGWQSMITKVIPGRMLGTFYGVQAAASNALGGISAILSGIILERVESPYNFALCFLLAALSLGISYVFLGQTREQEAAPRPPAPPRDFRADVRRILREDRNFVTFLAVRTLSQFASMAFAFYVIYAVRELGMGAGLAGIMTGVLLIAQVVAGPLMGRLGDHWSHRGAMFIGALAAALSALLAWRATSLNWFYAVFLLEAVAIVAIWIIPLALTVSFAPREEDRPLYIGLSSSLTAPATILAPILGGWIADLAGFHATFLVSAGWALLMAAALAFLVKEPHSHLIEISIR